MKNIYATKYGTRDVNVMLGDSGRLEVVYAQEQEHSFVYDYGSNGVMDVITEFVRDLLKNPQNYVDKP